MTTTVGRAKMEDLVMSQDTGGETMPKELLDLKFRYGELVDEEGLGSGVVAFGLIEETKMLKAKLNPE